MAELDQCHPYGYSKGEPECHPATKTKNAPQFRAGLTKLKYRIAGRALRMKSQTIAWIERFTPEWWRAHRGHPVIEEVTFTGEEQFLDSTRVEDGRIIQPPARTGRTDVLLPATWDAPDLVAAPGKEKPPRGASMSKQLGKTAVRRIGGVSRAQRGTTGGQTSTNPQRLQCFVNHEVEVIATAPCCWQLSTRKLWLTSCGRRRVRNPFFWKHRTTGMPSGYFRARWPANDHLANREPRAQSQTAGVTQAGEGNPLISDFEWSDQIPPVADCRRPS